MVCLGKLERKKIDSTARSGATSSRIHVKLHFHRVLTRLIRRRNATTLAVFQRLVETRKRGDMPTFVYRLSILCCSSSISRTSLYVSLCTNFGWDGLKNNSSCQQLKLCDFKQITITQCTHGLCVSYMITAQLQYQWKYDLVFYVYKKYCIHVGRQLWRESQLSQTLYTMSDRISCWHFVKFFLTSSLWLTGNN